MPKQLQDVKRGGKWRRFSIASLLVLTACVAGYLTGRRNGYRDGREMWNLMPRYSMVYSAGDLVQYRSPNDEINLETTADLVDYIQSTVAPKTWVKAGGDGEMSEFPENNSLVISTNQYVHAEIANLLESLRRQVAQTAATDGNLR